jgi:nucleoside-diphosphate-sugar epimerase
MSSLPSDGIDVWGGLRSERKKSTSFKDNQKYLRIDACPQKIFAEENFDFVVHTAGIGQAEVNKNKKLAFEVNSEMPVSIFRAAQSSGVKLFVFFSSIQAARFDVLAQSPNLHELTADDIYGYLKFVAEQALKNAFVANQTSLVIFRIANSFGFPARSNEKCWRLFSNQACKEAVLNGKIRILSDPNTKRDFLPVSLVENEVRHSIFNHAQESVYFQKDVISGSALTLLEMSSLISMVCQKCFNFEPVLEHCGAAIGPLRTAFDPESFLEAKGFSEMLASEFLREIEDLLRGCERLPRKG